MCPDGRSGTALLLASVLAFMLASSCSPRREGKSGSESWLPVRLVAQYREFALSDSRGSVKVWEGFEADAFHEGLAVARQTGKAEGALGFVDKRGDWVVPPRYQRARPFSEGYAWVSEVDEGGWFVINRAGKRVSNANLAISDCREFREGVAAVQDKRGAAWGFLTPDGTWAVKPEFQEATDFENGEAFVAREVRTFGEGDWYLLSRDGKLTRLPFSSTDWDSEWPKPVPAEGWSMEWHDQVNYVDRDGTVVFGPFVTYGLGFRHGLVPARLPDDRWVLLNSKGEVAVQLEALKGYDVLEIGKCSREGYFPFVVQEQLTVNEGRGETLIGFVDTDGTVVVPPVCRFNYGWMLEGEREQLLPCITDGWFRGPEGLIRAGRGYESLKVLSYLPRWWNIRYLGEGMFAGTSGYGCFGLRSRKLLGWFGDVSPGNGGDAVVAAKKYDGFSVYRDLVVLQTDGATVSLGETMSLRPGDRVTQAQPMQEGLRAVLVERGSTAKWSYIDSDGAVAFPFSFDSAFSFSDGLALVQRGKDLRFVDHEGAVRITGPWVAARPFSCGRAAVHKYGQKWYYIDTEGREVAGMYDEARDFVGGFAAVANGRKWGVIDTEGSVVVPLEFDGVGDHGEGLFATVDHYVLSMFVDESYTAKIPRWQVSFADTSGKTLLTTEFHEATHFSEGLCAVRMGVLWGYIDRTGRVVLPFEYEKAGQFVDGRARVRIAGSGRNTVIDRKGRDLLPQYLEALE